MKSSPETRLSRSVKQGDTYRLGEHVLACADAREIDLALLLDGRKIDCIATDPPYAIDVAAAKRGLKPLVKDKDIENDGYMSDEAYIAFTKAWLSPALPHLAPKNTVYAFNSDKMVFALRAAFVELGIKTAQIIVWVKSQPVMGRLDYLPQHELILYGWKGMHEFRRGKDKSVIFERKPARSALHPTMKPVSLMRRLILNSTKVGDTVYDPFGGSGTTLIACEHTKRRCVMVETDVEYCATIIKRWEALTGHRAEHLKNAG